MSPVRIPITAALLVLGCGGSGDQPESPRGVEKKPVAGSQAGTVVSAPLEVLVENAADPFSRADGTGYANDVVRAAFAAAGVPIMLTIVPYVRCKSRVLEGSAALCFSMSWDPSFQGKVKFADTPLFSVWPVYFERRDHPLRARSEDELGRGVMIGTIRSYEYPESTLQARERGAIFAEGSSESGNLKKLAAGRLDTAMVMANSLTGTRLWLEQSKVHGLVREAFRSPSQQVAFLGASTAHPRGLWALENYNRGIAIIEKNGVLDRIRKQW
jgi:polar amino acid transport system substrate-binding protein